MQSDSSATAVARAAIRRLAERRIPPTPENYALAWVACGGGASSSVIIARTAETALRLLADRGELAAPIRSEIIEALRGPNWEGLAALVARIEAQPAGGEGWRDLLPSLVSGLEAAHAGWTYARKRDGVLEAVEALGRNPVRLRQRLAALVESWRQIPAGPIAATPARKADPGLSSAPASAHPGVPQPAAPSASHSAGADADAEEMHRRLERSERALTEMRRLLQTLCDSVGALSDDDSWLRGQMEALRDVLAQGGDRRSVSMARQMLEQTAHAQEPLFERKRQALRQLREALAGAIGHAADLGDSTGDFGRQLSHWTEQIEQADSIEALDALARGLVSDARAMQDSVRGTHGEFVQAHRRAQNLETEVARLERELAETSQRMLTDHLTQALNRRGLDDAWAAARLQARRLRQPLSLALLDIDDFKRLNDAFGHLAGDGALQHLARLLQSRLRPNDSVARWGGEEFILLLPGSDATHATQVMQRLQRELTREIYLHENQQVFLTFSAGVSELCGDESFEAVVARADEAMYHAKRAGKNCVLRG